MLIMLFWLEMLAVRDSKGEDSPDAYEALDQFVTTCTEIALGLIDRQEHASAKEVLQQADQVLRSQISKRHPNLQYKISYRFAELANAQGDANESLTYLKQAITYAEDYEKLNKDPLLLMPAETYLNTAIAQQYN